MWHWDQGHLPYFQFDALRQIGAFVLHHDFKIANRTTLFEVTGLNFAGPSTHNPWRQYSRVLKRCLLVCEIDRVAVPTPVATLLSQPGLVTCDEYFHFLIRSYTEPSPAAQDWNRNAEFRFPLLFSLKYILTKASIALNFVATLDEMIGAYRFSGFDGSESDLRYIDLVQSGEDFTTIGSSSPENLRRQARESLKVIAQISYLHTRGNDMFISLSQEDSRDIFHDLTPILGPVAEKRDAEILRLATLFQDGFTDISFDFPNTVVEEVVESGFQEGNKVKKTHLTIERNSRLRREFFLLRPTAICDVCRMNTQESYPWTERVIDLHHLLPLSSGTRVEVSGTTLDDLVPVCPSCHRAIHRYYDRWLRDAQKADFVNRQEAISIYERLKADFPGVQYV